MSASRAHALTALVLAKTPVVRRGLVDEIVVYMAPVVLGDLAQLDLAHALGGARAGVVGQVAQQRGDATTAACPELTHRDVCQSGSLNGIKRAAIGFELEIHADGFHFINAGKSKT